ncbi:hypothetical protein ABZ465_00730 [Streptomyces griseoincarnatus]
MVALLFLIAVGGVLIHRLNVQHGERIAAFTYSDALPGVGRRARRHRRSEADGIAASTGETRDRGEGDRRRNVMAILRERQAYREKVMRAVVRTAGGDRQGGVDGAKLQDDLGIPEQDFLVACTHLADEGWIIVDRGPGDRPTTIRLTPRGVGWPGAGTERAAEPAAPQHAPE